jgi:hypothetical protein
MAITTGDGYIAAAKQVVPWTKTAAVTTVNTTRYTTRGAAGNPGAGTLAFGSAVPGQVLTDATASSGFPTINAFGGAATGYLSRVQWNNSVVGRIELWDMLYSVNIPSSASGFTSLQTLTVTNPASYLGRCPDGLGNGLRIFVEVTTNMSASATTVTCTYSNSAASPATGRTTASSGSMSGFVAGRWVELALQAGDSGVSKLESIIIGGATNAAGVANVIIARRLWGSGTRVANSGSYDGIDMTGMPIVYESTALCVTTVADSTSSGLVDLDIEIANG